MDQWRKIVETYFQLSYSLSRQEGPSTIQAFQMDLYGKTRRGFEQSSKSYSH